MERPRLQVCDGATPNLCSAVQSTVVTIMAVNDAPGRTAPVAAATPEDAPPAFSGANLLGVTDADSATLQAALTVDHGMPGLASLAGLSFRIGDGTADANMTFLIPHPGVSHASPAASGSLSFTPVGVGRAARRSA